MTVEALENAVEQLNTEELAAFREWFMKFDAAIWDSKVEEDIRAGKLDALAQEAIEEAAAGNVQDL